ncbi:MAG: hypothetical protein DRR19_07900 [Candidatus Parabeggiatoa sp. nov. 1]|nr:MAG: hypothetical protein DRR19_07900 [Gammaproteobacteria bacterium]
MLILYYSQPTKQQRLKTMNSSILKLSLSILVILLGSFQGTQVKAAWDSPTTSREKRVALVIGNADYRLLPLKNPINDARDMANVLRGLGFQVIREENASRQAMDEAIEAFGQQLGKGTVGLFYFSGHGIQYEGKNYLIPIGMSRFSATNVKYGSVTVSDVLKTMKAVNNTMNYIILDACSENPFSQGRQKEFARMDDTPDVPNGTLIAYAASPGKYAIAGNERNSLYTKHLLKFLQKPGLTVEQMFEQVRDAVVNETEGKQRPLEFGSPLYDFYLAYQTTGKFVEEQTSIAIADKNTGCKMWGKPNDKITWSGQCVNGFAEGKGILKRYRNGSLFHSYDGYVRNGKLQGQGLLIWVGPPFNRGQFEGIFWEDQLYNGFYIATNSNRFKFRDGKLIKPKY